MFKVRLINREASHGQTGFPVCGKSHKNYGQSALRPEFKGFVFEMSLEDYERDKFDIIGNQRFQQVWVPEFYEAETIVPEKGTLAPENGTLALGDGTQVQISDTPPRKEKSIEDRARLAGVYKKGMSEDEMKEALGFPD